MAFDQATRNLLARFVADARRLIAEEFTNQFQSLYGISDSGEIAPLQELGHLGESQKAIAARLRERINYLVESHPDETKPTSAAVERLAREQAFTILNRLAAIRMAEKRGLIVESVGKGYQSKGFQVYSQVAGSGLGETYDRYRRYLFCLFDELAVDLGVLFDRLSPSGILFPREKALLDLIKLLNASDLEALWAEDETIGWIYQYYNDPAERKKMREKSAAPRDSYELAVRNQFFTPRYVVEFLTDNTLGRIWYEMTRGETKLKDQCRYLVRRPNEIFLEPGEAAPEQPKQDNLSQEEFLKQPVYIPHRPFKDPRTILMLDPACGSMHFGLYAFDLFEIIYEEAWELEEKLGAGALSRTPEIKSLHDTYVGKDAFLKDVPRLIIERNLNGIDIDPRCAQIAGLSLWLRAQKAWQLLGLKLAERPRIKRSNIVCAEPMPGDKELLREFVDKEFPAAERGVFQRLLEKIFDKMELAGEAGSLLKIEEEIHSAITEAKKLWKEGPQLEQTRLFADLEAVKQQELKIDLSGITDEQFWEHVEERIYAALRDYAQQAENGGGFQRRLFAEDAARGFAFIDVCRKRYDVVLMNPPFGDASTAALQLLDFMLSVSGRDIGAAFVRDAAFRWSPGGRVGALLATAPWFKPAFERWRECLFFGHEARLQLGGHFGGEVLDGATVTASPMVLAQTPVGPSTVFRLTREKDLQAALRSCIETVNAGEHLPQLYFVRPEEVCVFPGRPFCYWLSPQLRKAAAALPPFERNGGTVKQGTATADEPRFARAWWEIPADSKAWSPYTKTSTYSPYWDDITWVGLFENGLKEILATGRARVQGTDFFGKAGVTYTSKAVLGFNPRLQPPGCGFGHTGSVIFSDNVHPLALLGFFASGPVEYLLSLFIGELQGKAGVHPNHYEVGTIQRLPWPGLTVEQAAVLLKSASGAVTAVLRLHQQEETTRSFVLPIVDRGLGLAAGAAGSVRTERERLIELCSHRKESDRVVAAAYGFSADDTQEMDGVFTNRVPPSEGRWRIYFGQDGTDITPSEYVGRCVSWALGIAFGRWSLLAAVEDIALTPDSFLIPPAKCPPGQLQNAQGLPARPEDVPAEYPVRIPWDGILVDEPGHLLDIERRVRDIIEIIWKDRAEGIEQEACEILGVKSLCEYFRKPTGFFANHLKRYSKSRRQAPIYWPLSTASGSYTLWICYHRLTDQTLHAAIADFLDPKIKALKYEIAALRERASGSSGNQAGELVDFQDELKALRAELERVIKLQWKPNLNDGVLITASPLWKLFRLTKWQKDLKACWEALEKGDYDWAHLAYSIWPQRVEKLCETDRSVAIAHGLEHLYKGELPKSKPKRRKKKVAVEQAKISSEL